MYQRSFHGNNNKLFNDYYKNNNGKLFKIFKININNNPLIFDIYWGDPDIIFDKLTLVPYPLAFIKFPKWKNDPNTRIYLHEKVDINYATAFEFILAHEIGHFCLFDIFGINHPKGNVFLDEYTTEVWADFFAYKYFMKYRNINNFEQFEKILIEVDNLQNFIYNITPDVCKEYSFTNKIKDLQLLKEKIQTGYNNGDQNILLMLGTFEKVLIQIKELI
jgi:predicted SprT family Zn-dependent metalloprotease